MKKAKQARRPATPVKTTAKPPKASKALVALYEGLQTNVFETVFRGDVALAKTFIAWAKATHRDWYDEVDEDDSSIGRAIKLEMLITDEIEEAAFVAFFETLPAEQKKHAVAAMTAAGEADEDEDDEDDEDDDEEKDPTVVDLSGKNLTEVPAELATRTDIKRLDLSNNKLTTLPSWIGKLTKLEHLDLGENPLRALPAELAHCSALETLMLFKCKTVIVPPIPSLRTVSAQATSEATVNSLCASRGITDLRAQEMALTAVPEAIRSLEKLDRLDLSGNKLKALPRWLAELPLEGLFTFGNPMPASEMEWARSALELG